MAGVQVMTLAEDADGLRLDRWLKRTFPQLTQGRIEKMCRKGELRLDGGRVKASARLAVGQSLRVPPIPAASAEHQAKAKATISRITDEDAAMIRSCVIYKDDDLIAINKPPGLASQGGTGTTRHVDLLSEALKFDREDKPKLVHRLDRDTSGILVLARHGKAAAALSKALQDKTTRKIYWAAVAGCPHPRMGTIRYGLVKAGGHGVEKMICIHPNEIEDHSGAKRATSDYTVLEAAGKRVTWVGLVPITGRTHQLRAHMAEIGHPVIGDGKYGGNTTTNDGDGWGAQLGGEMSKKLHLHARTLMLDHPFSGARLVLTAELPDHMARTWETLGWDTREHVGDPFEDEFS